MNEIVSFGNSNWISRLKFERYHSFVKFFDEIASSLCGSRRFNPDASIPVGKSCRERES